MKTDPAICNYALLRYLPYPERGEFVNVGVVVACVHPITFDFWMDVRETFARVRALFPELDQQRFEAAYGAMRREFERVKAQIGEARDPKAVSRSFRELVRPRESSFRFGEIRTTSSPDPGVLAEELFSRYVRRTPPPAVQAQEAPKG